ncbi:DNA-3-methyladenine glycosylase I [Endozoicomonadaceae bacterium StTr2]
MTTTERCPWCSNDELYQRYHDEEWGVPTTDDSKLFEFLILEGAQAGLNWLTILKRREGYRQAFAQFDPVQIAKFDESKQAELLQNPGIIRNRLKVASAIKNARAFLEIQQEHGRFAHYLWQFVDGQPIQNQWKTLKEVPAHTSISDALSKDLKKRGMSFVGSTIMYAYMQAMGLVNDHLVSCPQHDTCRKLGDSFKL